MRKKLKIPKVKNRRPANPGQYSKLMRPNSVIKYTKNMSIVDIKERRLEDLEYELRLEKDPSKRDYYRKEVNKTKIGLERRKFAVDSLDEIVKNGFAKDTIEYAYNINVYNDILDCEDSRITIHEDYAEPIKYYQDKISEYKRSTEGLFGKIGKKILSYVPSVGIGGTVAATAYNNGVPLIISGMVGGTVTAVMIGAQEVILAVIPQTNLAEKFERDPIEKNRKKIKTLRKEEKFEKKENYDLLVDNVKKTYITYKKDRYAAQLVEQLSEKKKVRKLRILKKKARENEIPVYEMEGYEVEECEEKTTSPYDVMKEADLIEEVKKIYKEEQEQDVSPKETYRLENQRRQAFEAQQKRDMFNKDEIQIYSEKE